jgi:hypothetical protein
MERYNALFMEGESPGLHLLKTDAYVRLIQENPGLVHENWGDFYIDMPHFHLAERIWWALEEEGLNEDADIVEADSFDHSSCDPTRDYIIKSQDGVRLYSPEVHEEGELDAEVAYGLLCCDLADEVFSQTKEGSLQKDLNEECESLCAAVGACKQKAEEVGVDLDRAYGRLKRYVERLEARAGVEWEEPKP